jgi:hypothetical protein
MICWKVLHTSSSTTYKIYVSIVFYYSTTDGTCTLHGGSVNYSFFLLSGNIKPKSPQILETGPGKPC